MRDDKNGAIFHQQLKGFLHAVLAVRIQLRCGLWEGKIISLVSVRDIARR